MSSIPLPAPAEHRAPRLLPAPRVMVRDVAYLAPAMAIGIASFTVVVTGLALALGLAVTVVGVAFLVATLYLARGLGVVERRRAAWLLETPIPDPERAWTGGPIAIVKAAATDRSAWRDAFWALMLMPVGVAVTTAGLTLWATALGMISAPAWWWAIPTDGSGPEALNGHGLGPSLLRVAIGVALVPVAAWTCRGLAAGTARLTRAAIG
jgi:hypothetical protein